MARTKQTARKNVQLELRYRKSFGEKIPKDLVMRSAAARNREKNLKSARIKTAKKKRYRPPDTMLCQIRAHQCCTKTLIQKTTFKRVVQQIAFEISGGLVDYKTVLLYNRY